MIMRRGFIAFAVLCLLAIVLLPRGWHDFILVVTAISALTASIRKETASHALFFATLAALPIVTLSKWYEPAIVQQSTSSRLETLQAELNVIDGVLTRFFNNNAAALEALKLLIASEPYVSNELYQQWLQQLLPDTRNNFLNIAFSRELIIEYVYPENSVNLPVIGVNQREIPVQGDIYRQVYVDKTPITMGPVMLVQGVPGILYVNPIPSPNNIIVSAVLSLEALRQEVNEALNKESQLSLVLRNGDQSIELFTGLSTHHTVNNDHRFNDVIVQVGLSSPLIEQAANRTKVTTRLSALFFWAILTLLMSWQSAGIRQRDQQRKIIEENTMALLSAQRIGQMGSWQYRNNLYDLSLPLQELLGINQRRMVNKQVLERIHPSDIDKLALIWSALKSGKQGSHTLEQRILVHNSYRWFEHRIAMDIEGNISGILRDINSIKEREQQVTLLESFDALTGASNRRHFQMLVQQNIAICDRHKSLIALAIFSIDKFRVINEQHGQGLGDELLKLVSQRMRSTSRKSDIIARLSGDIFAIAFVDLKNIEQATIAIEQMHQAMREPYHTTPEVFPQFTVAVSIYPDDADDFDSLLQKAEQALQNAKSTTRGSSLFYSKNLSAVNQRRQLLLNKLPAAIRNNSLHMVYQPRVDSESHELIGIEALVRWQDDELGFVSPGEFIPLAEPTHLIVELGEWVIASVFSFISEHKRIWPSQLIVSINLSPKQLEDKHLVVLLKSLLDKYQLEARFFEFEVTEHSIAVESETVLKNMEILSQMGFLFALDDFGTGYSNLGILQSLPLHVLKIDMTFIRKIGVDKRSDALVDAIVNMSHTLNLTTVAEGVETLSQVEYLQQVGCEQLQGYYFYKPLSQSELITEVKSRFSDQ